LEPTEDGGIVRVTVLRDSWQRVAVVVQDDGIGIDPSGRKKDDGGRVHIGIENVYERLQVYFESQATVTVERASQSGGTRAVLLFPARRERWA
jgi:sensor histidine kinase YesM